MSHTDGGTCVGCEHRFEFPTASAPYWSSVNECARVIVTSRVVDASNGYQTVIEIIGTNAQNASCSGENIINRTILVDKCAATTCPAT